MNATILQKIFLSIAFLINLFAVFWILEDGLTDTFLPVVITNFVLFVFYKIWGEPKK